MVAIHIAHADNLVMHQGEPQHGGDGDLYNLINPQSLPLYNISI